MVSRKDDPWMNWLLEVQAFVIAGIPKDKQDAAVDKMNLDNCINAYFVQKKSPKQEAESILSDLEYRGIIKRGENQ